MTGDQQPQPAAISNCSTCQYWLQTSAGRTPEVGWCRCEAPRILGWPGNIRATDWCGQYSAGLPPSTP